MHLYIIYLFIFFDVFLCIFQWFTGKDGCIGVVLSVAVTSHHPYFAASFNPTLSNVAHYAPT